MSKKKQEVATTAGTALATNDQLFGASTTEEILASDMLIPRVQLMQGLSDLVANGQAMSGQIVRSTTAEVLAEKDKTVDIIPLTFRNMWLNKEMTSAKGEFRGMEPRNASNEHLDWEWEENGVTWKRTKVLELFALLPGDIEADMEQKRKVQEEGALPDLNKALMPVVITFQSTSFKAGKSIVDHFTRARQYGIKPFAYQLKLGSTFQENDKGKFYVFKFDGGSEAADRKYFELSQHWADTLTAGISEDSLKIDDSNIDEGTSGPARPGEY